jgi:hypothetical protein
MRRLNAKFGGILMQSRISRWHVQAVDPRKMLLNPIFSGREVIDSSLPREKPTLRATVHHNLAYMDDHRQLVRSSIVLLIFLPGTRPEN